MKTNYHTHTTWCDGKNTPRQVADAAIEKGFAVLGFSSHSMLPEDDVDWVLTPEKAPRYAADIRALAAEYAPRLRILCGVEADYVPGPGGATPDRAAYSSVAPDYVIGSIHFVIASDGARVPVDHSPGELAGGIRDHFGGSAETFVKAYFAQEREMVGRFDFDILGHPDLVRKFNVRHPYFDEQADWYRKEIERTADAIAASCKVVEVNTGAISRGWLDDVYPSAAFRELLRARGTRFVLSSDSHSADTIDCAFDRFAAAEEYLAAPPWLSLQPHAVE